jgi:hypothetical protein
MELQGAAGGHLEVLQQVPESCIRKINLFIYFQDSSDVPSWTLCYRCFRKQFILKLGKNPVSAS